MRTALAVLIILLFAPFGGVVTGSAEQPVDLGIEGDEILPTYSRAVQLAFERVGAMSDYSEQDLAGANEWLVVTRVPLDKHQWTKAAPASSEPAPILRGAYIWNFKYPIESIPLLQQSLESGEIESFSPLVEKKQHARLTPDDTEFDEQWHLENTGQTNGLSGEDVNVTNTWDTYTGSGVVISVVDDGLDHAHSDLSPHYSSLLSYDWCDDDSDPSPSSSWNGHGTAVAGVAAAVGNNALDVTGVAFNATIAGSTLIACWAGDATEAEALSYERDDIDIYTNSWGPADDGRTLEAPGPLTLAAFESDAYSGRDGLGNLITWAAGNGLGSNDDSNYDGYANSRFTIAVTAINHNGEQSNYAEPGANILVAAHSEGDGEGITTTDITGSGGYSNGNVTHTFGGTSSATPLVAGVIALVLDANENLTWRDVQHVLVNSARMNDASDSSWTVNGAGHDVSHKYGFGVVDAGAAVAVAESWVNVGEEFNSTYGPYTLATDIPDGDTSWSEYTTVVTDEYSLESVDLVVDITHAYRGDLDIVLVSPSGTESWLAESHSDNGNDYSDWMFSTVRHWDESSLGTWTLKVRDSSTGENGTLDSWELILHGVDADYDHDNDGLSDENETLIYGTDPYDADSDDDGLSDYDEVIVYGTNPLAIDSDMDGLTDAAEVMNTGTDPLDSDTDDDGLSDGAEINYWQSDPLWPDPDADSDLFYHFNDCNDTNPNVNPGKPELLNSIDDNCDDNIDEGYNFTDRDNDGLKDWSEYHIHGTDYMDSDTDDDGLDDGEEVNTYAALGSDPLVYDPDADADSWYWFEDCDDEDGDRSPGHIELLDDFDNDCDFLIDEDYWTLDTDNDGLTDYDEYHNITTDHLDGDTDDDGLPDGLEYNEYSSMGADPLVHDADADSDGWYWFQDCDDGDFDRAPLKPEVLDGKDNDCDEVVDEDFFDLDSDDDGLTDFDEFHNITTNPGLADTDADGMSDGHEVMVSGSDPMKFNFDRDEDGFYDFEDCEDLVDTINPAGVEAWNGWDDDCNDAVDDGLSRKNLVTTTPDFHQVYMWDAVNESLDFAIGSIPNNVVATLSWQIGDYTLIENVSSDGRGVFIGSIDCEARDTTLTIYLCNQGSSPQQLTATLVDSGQTTIFLWDIEMDVWITPETLSEKLLSFVTSPTGLAASIILLLTVIGGCTFAVRRFSHKRKLKDAYQAYNLKPEKFTLSTEFLDYNLPSAPDLSALMGQQNTPVVLPSVPVVEDEDGIPRAPELD